MGAQHTCLGGSLTSDHTVPSSSYIRASCYGPCAASTWYHAAADGL